jgi:uncharacterized spore protein YtfJ
VNVEELLAQARQSVATGTVFAEPVERDGVTVIAAAHVMGGGGGGTGEADGQQGEGGGFGLNARPAGAYVIKDGQVRWQPAVDPVRILSTVAAVVITLIVARAITVGRAISARRRAQQ